MDSAVDHELLSAARETAERAYCPYSRFRVGAAVRAEDGRVFSGCNVENASYGLSMCAERTAVFAAAAAGARRITAVAVSCLDGSAADAATRMPCGACCQVLSEFASRETPVTVDGAGVFPLSGLLPHPFRLEP